MSDAEKTLRLKELVRECYPRGGNGTSPDDLAARWLVLDEVRNAAGFGATRSADLVAVSLWPSDGLFIIGHETKVSRTDLKRELSDHTKATETARYCDVWWLVVWDEKLLAGLDIPAEWGIKARVVDGDDEQLKIVRKVPTQPKADRTQLPVDRSALAAFLRCAARASAGAWHLAEVARVMGQHSFSSGEAHGRRECEHEIEKLLEPLKPSWRAANPNARSWHEPTLEELCKHAATLVSGATSLGVSLEKPKA